MPLHPVTRLHGTQTTSPICCLSTWGILGSLSIHVPFSEECVPFTRSFACWVVLWGCVHLMNVVWRRFWILLFFTSDVSCLVQLVVRADLIQLSPGGSSSLSSGLVLGWLLSRMLCACG